MKIWQKCGQILLRNKASFEKQSPVHPSGLLCPEMRGVQKWKYSCRFPCAAPPVRGYLWSRLFSVRVRPREPRERYSVSFRWHATWREECRGSAREEKRKRRRRSEKRRSWLSVFTWSMLLICANKFSCSQVNGINKATSLIWLHSADANTTFWIQLTKQVKTWGWNSLTADQ